MSYRFLCLLCPKAAGGLPLHGFCVHSAVEQRVRFTRVVTGRRQPAKQLERKLLADPACLDQRARIDLAVLDPVVAHEAALELVLNRRQTVVLNTLQAAVHDNDAHGDAFAVLGPAGSGKTAVALAVFKMAAEAGATGSRLHTHWGWRRRTEIWRPLGRHNRRRVQCASGCRKTTCCMAGDVAVVDEIGFVDVELFEVCQAVW